MVTLTDLRGRQIGSGLVEADGSYLCRLVEGADADTVLVMTSAPGYRPGISEVRRVTGPTRRHVVLAPMRQGAAAVGVGAPGSFAGQLPR
jgi:hypothetical protein